VTINKIKDYILIYYFLALNLTHCTEQLRLRNKGVYVKMGLRKVMGRCGKLCRDLQRELRLEVDGKVVDLPPVEGIIILNILR
jgi:hypothetical protein